MHGLRLSTRLTIVFATFYTISAFSFPSTLSVPYGWYLEANGGSSHLSEKSYPGSESSSGIGGNVNLGYKFMPYFATEIGYTQYANTHLTDQTNTRAANEKHYAYGIALRGIVPIMQSGVELFAKLGAGRMNSSLTIVNSTAADNLGITRGSHSAIGLYMGAGIQYYFMPEFAVNTQWQRQKGSSATGTEDLWSVGLSFIFD